MGSLPCSAASYNSADSSAGGHFDSICQVMRNQMCLLSRLIGAGISASVYSPY